MKNLSQTPKHKLSLQLLIGFGTSLLLVGVTAISFIYISLKLNLEEQVQQRAKTITQGIEFATEGLIEDKETFLLERIVQNYATLPTVLEISITDPNGVVLSHSRMMNIGETNTFYRDIHPTLEPYLQQASHNGTEVDVRTVLNGKPVIVQFLPFSSTLFKKTGESSSELSPYRGVAIAVMDLQELEQEALKSALWSILAMTVSALLILAFMGWLIRQLVLIPLARINLAIAEGEKNEKFSLPALPNNEIGSLGSTFASVFKQLKAYKQMELEIAERKYAEIAQRYELATHAAKVWVWDWNSQNYAFVLEKGIQDWLGYVNYQTPKDLNAWLDCIYIDDRELFRDTLQNHLDGKTSEFACEHRLLDANGVPHWFLSRGQTVLNDDGKVIRVIGTITDIAERKQSELVIRKQTERELLIREITQKIRQTLDLQTVFETAVKEIRLFLNADRVGIFKFYPESNFDDGEFVAESVLPKFTSMMTTKVNGHCFHCFEERCDSIYQHGEIRAIEDIHNAGLADCHISILAQFQIQANLVVPLLKSNKLWGLLCIHQCANPRAWQDVEIDLVKQISNQLAIAIQQVSLFERLQKELLERKQAEKSLTESNQKLAISNSELSRATRLKDEFLANMSHELRTPLNAILGMNEALQDGVFGAITEKQLKSLLTIEGSSRHLLALINDILDVAKIESGQITLDLTPVSIENLCRSSLTFIRQQALTKQIQLIEKIPQYLPEIMLDERRMRQVLINLLNNAVKFTPQGGVITLEVSHTSAEQGVISTSNTLNYLKIAVIDTGIGISEENIQKLFQPFIQIDSALNRQYQGTGLGLALVKSIIELHGGKVALTSELGVGSCFMVEMPFNAPTFYLGNKPENSSKKESSKDFNQIENNPSSLILLAEDNEANIATFSSYLEAKGYRVILAKDGKVLIDLAKTHHPDLIVTDIQMPVIDGIEAIKQIRLDPSLVNIPIIALTALAMKGDRERCVEAGANEYMAKPVKLKALSQIIQNLLTPQGENYGNS